jgi:2-oxoglutarate dehydrogenase E2 component (dihydrolipoamide succinyltransferase)
MNERISVTLPKLGESVVSATVVQWFKKPGDWVKMDEPLLEVSTDKVNSEIPSPASGFLQEILASPCQEVPVGGALAILSSSHETDRKINKEPRVDSVALPPKIRDDSEDALTPSVLHLMKEKGIDPSEIDRIPKTGYQGRLTKKDVEAYAASRNQHVHAQVERMKMTSMRKTIADNMVRSFYEAPHASLISEIDVTDVVRQIKERKEAFFQKTGAKLTITSFAAYAVARAVKVFPLINSSLENDTIVMKHFVNLGIAVSVDQGIMIPVIHNCQEMSVEEISCAIADLSKRARSHSLKPDEISGGTITVTNFGMGGTQIGIPIIRFPEVAIIGVGAITKKVMVMPDDTTAIRSVAMLSLTFDHRVLDGMYGCGFLNEVKKNLETYV